MFVKDNTFFSVRAESRNKLKLKSNELLIYSIIESIALTNKYYLFSGSLHYLMSWSGLTKPTVIKILNSLVEKKLIIRYDDRDYKNRIKPYYRLNKT